MSIHLDPDERYEQVLGFGAALTDASCDLLEQLDAGKRKTLLDECFGPPGLSFSTAHPTIGSSNYSLSAYSCDDTDSPDPELKHFSIEHDRKYILPLLREARQTKPELFYFSPPLESSRLDVSRQLAPRWLHAQTLFQRICPVLR
jgi:glucosylceramidase